MADATGSWDMPQATILTQNVVSAAPAQNQSNDKTSMDNQKSNVFEYDTFANNNGLDKIDEGLTSDAPAAAPSEPAVEASNDFETNEPKISASDSDVPLPRDTANSFNKIYEVKDQLDEIPEAALPPLPEKFEPAPIEEPAPPAATETNSFADLEQKMRDEQSAIEREIADMQAKVDKISGILGKIDDLKKEEQTLIAEANEILP